MALLSGDMKLASNHLSTPEWARSWSRSLSFAAVWLWCCIISRTDLFSSTQTGGVLFAIMDTPLLISNVIVLLVIVLLSGMLTSILNSKKALVGTTIAFVSGASLIVCGQEYSQFTLIILGVALSGASIAVLKIAWGEMFSRMSLKNGLVTMGYALIVSVVAFLITFVLPNVMIWVVFIVCAGACAPLLYYGTRPIKGESLDYGQAPAISKRPLKLSWTFIVLPVLVAFTYGVSHGIIALDAASSVDSIILSAVVGEGVVGLALLLVSRILSKRFGAAQIYAGALIFVIIGYLLLALQAKPFWIANGITSVGFHAFYFFMIVFWGDLAKRMNRPILMTYAVGYFAFQLAQLIGYLLALFVIQDFASTITVFLTMIIVLAFFAGALFLYGGLNSPVRAWLMADNPQETTDEISDTCASITKKAGLSPREHEILILLARGRNAAYIARTLFIAHSTVKTHIKSIYRKLDIHSQQNLMDLIDTYSCEEG